jgi:hypothetical protein
MLATGCDVDDTGKQPPAPPLPLVKLIRVGDSLRFEQDSLYQWIVDFEFRSDTAYIAANQANVNDYYVGTGGFFLYTEGGGGYRQIKLPGKPDRFMAIDSLRGEDYLLKLHSICRIDPSWEDCETMPIDTGFGAPGEFRRLFSTATNTYLVVGNQDGVYTQKWKLLDMYRWNEHTVKVTSINRFDYTGETYYWLGVQGMYAVPWNDIQNVELKRINMELHPEPAWDGFGSITRFKVIDGGIFQYGLGLYRSTYPYYAFTAKRSTDTGWNLVAIDSGTKANEPHIRAERFLDFPFGYDFTDVGKFVLLYDSRVLWLFRKSDLKTRRFRVEPDIIGAKWKMAGDRIYTNGFRSLYYVNIHDLESQFEAPVAIE